MNSLYVFLAVSLFAVISCEGESDVECSVIDPETLKGIQKSLERLDFFTKLFKVVMGIDEPEEERTCLNIGQECAVFSGPACCGVDTRCNSLDYQIPQRNGVAKWRSACRQYKLGVVLKSIGDFFSG